MVDNFGQSNKVENGIEWLTMVLILIMVNDQE